MIYNEKYLAVLISLFTICMQSYLCIFTEIYLELSNKNFVGRNRLITQAA